MMIWVYVRGDVDDDDVYYYGDVKFPDRMCSLHSYIHGNFYRQTRSKTRTRKNVRNSWYYSPYRNLVHEPNVPRQCTDAHTILKPAHVLEREPNP